jgi:hypothetical protein
MKEACLCGLFCTGVLVFSPAAWSDIAPIDPNRHWHRPIPTPPVLPKSSPVPVQIPSTLPNTPTIPSQVTPILPGPLPIPVQVPTLLPNSSAIPAHVPSVLPKSLSVPGGVPSTLPLHVPTVQPNPVHHLLPQSSAAPPKPDASPAKAKNLKHRQNIH